MKLFKSRRFKHGALATGVTVIFLAAVVALNFITTLLLERYPLTIDFTSEQIYQMDDQTVDYLKKLDTDVDITLLLPEDEFYEFIGYYDSQGKYSAQAEELFKKFNQYSGGKINIDFVDLNKNPDFTTKYSETLTQGSVIIESEKRRKIITVDQLFNFEESSTGTGEYVLSSSAVEQELLSAIVFVSQSESTKIALISGHDETDISIVTQILSYNNYETTDVRILSQDIPGDVSGVVIAAPTKDYTDEEIKKIDNFLQNNGAFGKNLFYFASSSQPELPKLEAYLKQEWGIEVGDGYVEETDQNYLIQADAGMYAMQNYAESEISGAIADSDNRPFVAVAARPLKAMFEESGNRKTTVLLESYESAVVHPSDAGENWKSSSGKKDVYPTAILSERSSVYNNEDVDSQVAVFGSVEAFTSQIMYMSSAGNYEYAASIFDTLTEKETGITILPRTLQSENLGLNGQIQIIMAVIFIGVIPVICLTIGLVIWIRRRNR